MKPDSLRAGRFIVETRDQRISGLAAHEAVAILETTEGSNAQVYLIHRVSEDGSIEMSGVRPQRLQEQDCILYTFSDVREARQIYDHLVLQAADDPPPCRVELRFCRVPQWTASSVIAATFSEPCQPAMAAWLQRSTHTIPQIAGALESGANALTRYREAAPRILERTALETWELQTG